VPFIGAALNRKPQCCQASKHNFFAKVNDCKAVLRPFATPQEAYRHCVELPLKFDRHRNPPQFKSCPRPHSSFTLSPLNALASGRCSYHPDRPGLGICVECRSVICQECTTQFEGINRCASCLAARTRKPTTAQQHREFSVANVALAALSFSLLFAGLWLLARLAQSTHGH
jgi:hypothetical protein